jgi:hypothetical protein
MSAAAPAQSMFQSNTIAALVPADARKKRQIRLVLQAFAEQFGAALTSRLQTYCLLQKVRTVTAETLKTAAEELLGVGAASVPQGIDEDSLPSTMVYLRFRRSLAGLRLEASCSRIVGIVGFNFLRYVQDILERVYGTAEEAKNVELATVIAALERPNAFSAAGMPCIAYRHDAATIAEAEGEAKAAPRKAKKEEEPAAVEMVAAPAAQVEKAAEKKKGKKKAAEAQVEAPKAAVEAVAVAATQEEAPKKAAGKKRARKEEKIEAAAIPQEAIAEAPKAEAPAKKQRARKGAAVAAQ